MSFEEGMFSMLWGLISGGFTSCDCTPWEAAAGHIEVFSKLTRFGSEVSHMGEKVHVPSVFGHLLRYDLYELTRLPKERED